jgi:hypothetical protein
MIGAAKDAWRRGKVLGVDIKGAFPNIVLDLLIHNRRCRGILEEYTRWIRRRVEGWAMVISFDYEAFQKLSDIMDRPGGTSDCVSCNFAIKKFRLMGLTRPQEKDPINSKKTKPVVRPTITIGQHTIKPSKTQIPRSYHRPVIVFQGAHQLCVEKR